MKKNVFKAINNAQTRLIHAMDVFIVLMKKCEVIKHNESEVDSDMLLVSVLFYLSNVGLNANV